MAEKKFDYLIVGNSAGGIGCIEGIRKIDRKGTIAIVSDEPHHVYSRPLITHLIEGHVDRSGLDFRPRDFYTRNGIEPFLGYRAVRVDAVEGRLALHTTGNGQKQTVRFGKMLLATGGKPFVPPIEGGDIDGITPMITLDQSLEVCGKLPNFRTAVVLGGGLIGTKSAEALARKIEKVTMVELGDRILAPVTDAVSSKMAMDVFTKNGVEIIVNETVVEAKKDRGGRIREVVLKSGKVLPCDLLVVAAGIRPRTEIAEESDIKVADMKVGGGIDVDINMSTSVDRVYACGDCAHAHDFVTGGMRLLPLWPNAYIGGRIAGLNMTGTKHAHRWATNMNSVDFFGFPMVSAGFMIKPKKKGFEEIIRKENGSYFKIILKDDVIRGLNMAGRVDCAGIYLGLMREKVVITSFKEELGKEFPSLLRFPYEIREKLRQPIREID